MVYTINTVKEFLNSTHPYKQLPPEIIDKLCRSFQPLRYTIGEVILKKDEMPVKVAIICEGKARWLGYDPRTEMPQTLKILGPGAILGAVNLVREIPCETALVSSEEMICLTLEKQEFQELLAAYPIIADSFTEEAKLLETFEVLGYQLHQTARGEGDLKDLSQQLLAEARLEELPAREINTRDFPHLLDPQWIWLVTTPAEGLDMPKGTILRLDPELPLALPKSLRIIGFKRQQWLRVCEQAAFRPEPEVTDADVVIEPEVLGQEETPESLNIPKATGPLPTLKPEKTETVLTSQDYPYVKGTDPQSAGTACFQMLSQYFGMPFRKEIINRVIGEQLHRQGSLSLDLCGSISELMGLNAQLVRIPQAAITRLSPPCLVRWHWQDYNSPAEALEPQNLDSQSLESETAKPERLGPDSLAIIYEISEEKLVIGVPEQGILRLKPDEFLKFWEEPGQVLLLKKTKETPQERFGIRWFLPYLTKYRRVLTEVFIASFFVQLFALANPLMIQIIIDKVIVQNSPDTLQVLGFFLLILAIFEAILSALRTYLFVDTTNRIDMSLGSEIIDHLLRLPLRYFERRPVGEISTRINELENIRQFLTGTALTVVLDAVFSVVYVVVMFIYSPLLSFVALGIIPLFVLLTWFFSPIIRRQLRAKAERNAETQSYLVEVMSGIQTVKAQNIELRSRWQWQQRYARYVDAGFNTVITSTFAGSASNFLNKLSALLVLWVGAYLVLQGKLSLGQLIAFRIISGYVTSPILRLTQLWQNFQETALSLERLSDIVDNPQEAEEDRDNIPMPLIVGNVKYKGVSFRFKPSGPLQLCNVSLEVPAGTFVGIVGESGAGKSTLTKLIPRLYEPEAGQILIDGYEINKVELYSLRRQIGMVPQETLLFDGTVQDNIALTNPDATTEEIIAAAKVAAAHDFIMSLPNGYNTRVGERGASLSGGQRQRIAIARSVLQKPRLLILDEATSALDYNTEKQVCDNLIHTFNDRTVFFITHRLGTIRNADLIILMSEGSIEEQGTHEELMKSGGRYASLYNQSVKASANHHN